LNEPKPHPSHEGWAAQSAPPWRCSMPHKFESAKTIEKKLVNLPQEVRICAETIATADKCKKKDLKKSIKVLNS
jgi:hypothetical protein